MAKKKEEKPRDRGLSEEDRPKKGFGISYDQEGRVRVQISSPLLRQLSQPSSKEDPVGIWIQKEVLKALQKIDPDADNKKFYYDGDAWALHEAGPVGNCDCRKK